MQYLKSKIAELRLRYSQAVYSLRLYKQFKYDMLRYLQHAHNPWARHNRASLEAQLTLEYHRIEKGLSLPKPQPFFGRQTVEGLVSSVRSYEAVYGKTLTSERIRAALFSYCIFHKDLGPLDFVPDEFRDDPLCSPATQYLERPSQADSTRWRFADFARSRHSVRNFTGEKVSIGSVERAVRIAQTAPSVCNRQSGRVHVIFDAATKEKVLALQNGNRGFGHASGCVVIVTSDLRTFSNSFERNQCWIDGGIFAMMLSLGFHDEGLGVCMLNWSANSDRDQQLRNVFPIPDHEAIITYMVVGHIPDKISVAMSARIATSEVLTTYGYTDIADAEIQVDEKGLVN